MLKKLIIFFSYSYSVLFTSFNYRIIIFIALSVNFFIIIFSLSLSFLQLILISFVFLIVANECKGLKIFFRMNRNHFIYIYNNIYVLILIIHFFNSITSLNISIFSFDLLKINNQAFSKCFNTTLYSSRFTLIPQTRIWYLMIELHFIYRSCYIDPLSWWWSIKLNHLASSDLRQIGFLSFHRGNI